MNDRFKGFRFRRAFRTRRASRAARGRLHDRGVPDDERRGRRRGARRRRRRWSARRRRRCWPDTFLRDGEVILPDPQAVALDDSSLAAFLRWRRR